MPNTMRKANKPSHITKGSVFDDLDLNRVELIEAKIKADLWRDLVGYIRPLHLTQKDLAKRLGVHQPDISNLLSGKLSKVSVGTLIHYGAKLDLGFSGKFTRSKHPTRSFATMGKKMKSAFEEMMKGLDDVETFLALDGKGFRVHVHDRVDVRAIRHHLHMTQAAFSNTFGFSLDAVKHWEDGRSSDPSARAYLTIIDKAPSMVIDILSPTHGRLSDRKTVSGKRTKAFELGERRLCERKAIDSQLNRHHRNSC